MGGYWSLPVRHTYKLIIGNQLPIMNAILRLSLTILRNTKAGQERLAWDGPDFGAFRGFEPSSLTGPSQCLQTAREGRMPTTVSVPNNSAAQQTKLPSAASRNADYAIHSSICQGVPRGRLRTRPHQCLPTPLGEMISSYAGMQRPRQNPGGASPVGDRHADRDTDAHLANRLQTGFSRCTHFSRYFRHARGLSPARYREQFAP